jgi:hypothetical protein
LPVKLSGCNIFLLHECSLYWLMRRSQVAAVVGLLVCLMPGIAQKLPAPSRTVYKCEADGKVVYSDSPCLGAKKVDVEPTRGLNKSTGSERVGADVRKERQNEQMANALKPILDETPEQRAKRHHRAELKTDARQRCGRLDGQIAALEGKEAAANGSDLAVTQRQLLDLRSEHRSLRC